MHSKLKSKVVTGTYIYRVVSFSVQYNKIVATNNDHWFARFSLHFCYC